MLEFKDLQSSAFKGHSTSMQLLFMFQDALQMVNQHYLDNDSVDFTRSVTYTDCKIDTNSFTILLRVYDLLDISYPVYWFSSQSEAYHKVCKKSHSRIEIEFCGNCTPTFAEIVYHVWVDKPLPF